MGNWPSISLVLRTIAPALKMAWLRSRRPRPPRAVGGDDPAQLAQRLGRDVGLELAADRALQLGALDREPVGVGGDHRHLLAAGADQDAGEDRAHVVARGGAGDQIDRLGERRGRDRQRLALLLGKVGEVLGGQDAQVEAGAAAADLDVALGLAQLDLDRRVAERAGELGEEAAGEEDRAARRRPRPPASSSGPSPGRSREADAVVVGGERIPERDWVAARVDTARETTESLATSSSRLVVSFK